MDSQLSDISIRLWQESEAGLDDESWDELLAKLGTLFEWLAGNPSQPLSIAPRSMALRLWCLLYAVRPDLIRNETGAVASQRFEVSDQRIFQVLGDLKAKTGISYESRLGRNSPESVRRSVEGILKDRAARKLARLAARRDAA